MRTKTMLLSALLGTLGSVSVMATTNVYSLNVVGYVNVTFPQGWSAVTCPLICSPDNTLNTLMPNLDGTWGHGNPNLFHSQVYYWTNGGYNVIEAGVATNASHLTGWSGGGADVALLPGVGAFVQNNSPSNITLTWVGTVPSSASGSFTNVLVPGWNLGGSIIPANGDLVTNSITLFTGAGFSKRDQLYIYDPTAAYNGQNWDIWSYLPASGGWSAQTGGGQPAHPSTPTPTTAIFYYNNTTTGSTNFWVENFSI